VILQVPVGVGREKVDELQIEKTNVAVHEAAIPEPSVTFFKKRRSGGALVEYAGQAPSLNKSQTSG
jgi:hypothetical protein